MEEYAIVYIIGNSGKEDEGRSKSYHSSAADEVVRTGRLHNEGGKMKNVVVFTMI